MRRNIFFIFLFLLMSVAGFSADGNRKFTLVIDAGHGGRDVGALGASSKEKNINLNVALAFGRYVERNCPDVRVVYTRKTDVFVPLDERANIANRAKADLFVSIHTNALPKGKIARGFEVYTLGMHRAADNLAVAQRENSVILVESDYKQRYEGFNPNTAESYIMFEFMQDKYMAQSVELAKMIQQNVCAVASRPNKGVHQAGFLVLRATSMPSCLIELGFITTPDEEQLLNSSSGIDAHARGIYNAFVKYRKKYDKNFVVPYEASGSTDVNVPPIVPEKEECPEQMEENKTTPSKRGNTDAKSTVAKNVKPVKKADNAVQVTNLPSEPAKPVQAKDKPAVSGVDNSDADKPVFKVQIMAGDHVLNKGNALFKGEQDVDYYKENGMVKYTVGASADYNKIYNLRKSLLEKFPQAFIVAFRNGNKMDVREAISEFRKNRNKN